MDAMPKDVLPQMKRMESDKVHPGEKPPPPYGIIEKEILREILLLAYKVEKSGFIDLKKYKIDKYTDIYENYDLDKLPTSELKKAAEKLGKVYSLRQKSNDKHEAQFKKLGKNKQTEKAQESLYKHKDIADVLKKCEEKYLLELKKREGDPDNSSKDIVRIRERNNDHEKVKNELKDWIKNDPDIKKSLISDNIDKINKIQQNEQEEGDVLELAKEYNELELQNKTEKSKLDKNEKVVKDIQEATKKSKTAISNLEKEKAKHEKLIESDKKQAGINEQRPVLKPNSGTSSFHSPQNNNNRNSNSSNYDAGNSSGNHRNLYGNPFGNPFGSQYGNQFGNLYGNPFGSQYGNPFRNPYGNLSGNRHGHSTVSLSTGGPTVYSGRGRPRNTDYRRDGSINYG